LAGELAKFDSGHALIARLIGEELARSNCDLGRIGELISKVKGKAEAFIILHINGLFKVHEDPNTAKALVEIFALRRPFVDLVRPGDPILTPGIVGLIGEKKGASLLQSAEGKELRGWLALRQHDLIEQAIKKLLKCLVSEGEECKELGDAPEPWKTPGVMETLKKVSEKVRDESAAVEYFVGNYGKRLTNTLKVFSNVCWKRAALIIGHALTGHPIVPRPEDLPEGLNRCGVDYYLLVDNVIPPLIRYLTYTGYTRVLTEAFIDKYNEAVAEVNRILNIARGRTISDAERLYGLGLASIIANAARLGRDVRPSDADIALHIASFTIQRVASPGLIKSVLGVLEPLYGKAPLRYLKLLAPASDMENLDRITVRYIFDKLNEILDNYRDVVRGYAWPLVHAIIAYAVLLRKYINHFNNEEVGDMVGKVVNLLNELDKFESSLGVIAWAEALTPALRHENVRGLMEEKLGIDVVRKNVVDKASEVLEKLNDMRNRIQELMGDKEFMSYIESSSLKADEEAVRRSILNIASHLKHELAIYRLSNNELDEAKKLFNKAAEERSEIGDYENELVARGWVLRVEAIKGSLVGKELADGFRQLYEKTFKEPFERTTPYLCIASSILGNFLVSLALINDVEGIRKLPEEHWWVLNVDKQSSVMTKLTLNALLSSKGGLSSELEGKLSVNPEELIDTFGSHMHREFLPALRVAFKMKSPEEEYEECVSIEDSTEMRDCEGAVLAVMNDSDAVWNLRWKLTYHFNKLILENETSGWVRELGFDANELIRKFEKLVYGLDGRSLVQLKAPRSSMAGLALMLHALISGNKELAKAHALYGVASFSGKLLTRLYLKVYKECCDLKNESFRHAIARLFFYHS
jgi:tetratricopeptide (TPR) repeat protein